MCVLPDEKIEKNRKKNRVTMGKTQSKCELEGNVKFMEIHFPGSTVRLDKWKKAPYMFGGNIGVVCSFSKNHQSRGRKR